MTGVSDTDEWQLKSGMLNTIGTTPGGSRGSATNGRRSGGGGGGNRGKRRVTRACDRCKQKKMRCTGIHPCDNCIAAKTTCEFNARYTRGKVPEIRVQDHQARQDPNVQVRSGSIQDVNDRVMRLDDAARESRKRDRGGIPESVGEDLEEEEKEENDSWSGDEQPWLDDSRAKSQDDREYAPDGDPRSHFADTRYGPSQSGRRLGDLHRMSVSHFGDGPMPGTEDAFLVLPPTDIAKDLIDKYFKTITPSEHILHRGTIEQWLDDVLNSYQRTQPLQSNKQAIVLLVFGLAFSQRTSSTSEEESYLSYRYYQAAESLLIKASGTASLETVQARLLQCFYLLARSRINQAWSSFSTVVSEIYSLGLHRKPKIQKVASCIHTECCKRTFWGAYTLDKHFNLILGRPQYLRDEDIDQELPQMINDEHLSGTGYLVTKDIIHSDLKSSVHQYQLSSVFGDILRQLYCIRPLDIEDQLLVTQMQQGNLSEKATEVDAFVRLDTSTMSKFRRWQILHLSLYCELIKVTLYRASLLIQMRPEVSVKLRDIGSAFIAKCVDASVSVVHILDELSKHDQRHEGDWIVHYSGYTAVTALYTYIIKSHTNSTYSSIQLFDSAEKCQKQIKTTSENGHLLQRCDNVLEQLRAEAWKCIVERRRPKSQDQSRSEQVHNIADKSRSEQPQYLEDYANVPVNSLHERARRMPEVTYGAQWQDTNFDQTAPGGGILGSMDWIRTQGPVSVIDQIQRNGFSSLTGDP